MIEPPGGSQSCAKEDAQSASRSSRAIGDRDLLLIICSEAETTGNPRFTFEKLYARISHRQRRLKGYVSLRHLFYI